VKRLKKAEILVLRTCKKNGLSRGDFKWPLVVGAIVTAPDWDGTDDCGGGLHGLPWGEGGNYCDINAPFWLVLRVNTSSGNYRHGTGEMTDKCKFKTCIVEGVFDNPKDATDLMLLHAPSGTVCNYATVVAGDLGNATAGDEGTATAGDEGTATAGNEGTATAGDWGNATAGDEGIICIKRHDGTRYRLVVGYIGEGGLLPNTPYTLDKSGNFVLKPRKEA
jgi:hypothetical protein